MWKGNKGNLVWKTIKKKAWFQIQKVSTIQVVLIHFHSKITNLLQKTFLSLSPKHRISRGFSTVWMSVAMSSGSKFARSFLFLTFSGHQKWWETSFQIVGTKIGLQNVGRFLHLNQHRCSNGGRGTFFTSVLSKFHSKGSSMGVPSSLVVTLEISAEAAVELLGNFRK